MSPAILLLELVLLVLDGAQQTQCLPIHLRGGGGGGGVGKKWSRIGHFSTLKNEVLYKSSSQSPTFFPLLHYLKEAERKESIP